MSKMRLRSWNVTTLEPPSPEEVLASASVLPNSFDFLALPQEIRMYVYKYCLVSYREISLDEGKNIYHMVHFGSDSPSANDMNSTLVPPPLTIKVPTSFLYPSTANSRVIFLPSALSEFINKGMDAQIIPLAGVVQPENLNHLPKVSASAKKPFDQGTGIFVGPVHPQSFSYLPPCSYTPFVSFNAKLLQTCKTVYAEALPILYSKNQFALHHNLGRDYLLSRWTGRPLEYITDLRLEVRILKQLLDEGASSSIWSIMLRRCTQIRKVTLSFPDDCQGLMDYIRAIVRVAASAADIKKGTGEPLVTVKAILGGCESNYVYWAGGRWSTEVEYIMGLKEHPKMQVPRGTTIELMGMISASGLRLLQNYSRKGWYFERRSPENNCDIEADSWVELAWIKSQA